MPGSSKLISSIDLRHKKHPAIVDKSNNQDGNDDDEESIKVAGADISKAQQQQQDADNNGDEAMQSDDNQQQPPMAGLFVRRDQMLGEARLRRNKMIGVFNPFSQFNPVNYAYAAPVYYPPEFYDDFSAFYGYGSEDEDIMSRQSPSGHRRRPVSGGYKNSPIYYIRLPPTPYMFVPGLGYISQPPSYQPMAPAPQPISPFYNLPLEFLSNGKPSNIYQWGSPATQFAPQNPYAEPQAPQYGGYPSYQQRPQRPYQRPVNPYVQESKVTNLKGPFLFNGRPEEIFVLQNSFSSPIYADPRFPPTPYY